MKQYIVEFWWDTVLRAEKQVWAASEMGALSKALDILVEDGSLREGKWISGRPFEIRIKSVI